MSYIALYRKYRPQTFDQVVGQDTTVRILKNQIVNDRIAHAYLFTGIRGTGKTTLAKIFAKAINCETTKDGNPCLTCSTCITLGKDNQSDVIEIDGASNRGVDEIREIREKAVFPPIFGRYKVYIIDEVHMLTKEAFNALLKILEEPPGHIVFIFATTEPNKLPVTILSRCQRFDVRPIATKEIAEQLRFILNEENQKMEEAAIDTLARRGEHSMRDALSLLDQIIGLGTTEGAITLKEVLNFLGMVEEDAMILLVNQIFSGDLPGLSESMDTFFEMGGNSKGLIDQIIAMLREILIVKLSSKRAVQLLEMDEKTYSDRQKLGVGIETHELYAMLDVLIKERSHLEHTHLARLVLELALYKLCEFNAMGEDAPNSSEVSIAQQTDLQKKQANASQPVAPKQRKPTKEERPPITAPPSEAMPWDEAPVVEPQRQADPVSPTFVEESKRSEPLEREERERSDTPQAPEYAHVKPDKPSAEAQSEEKHDDGVQLDEDYKKKLLAILEENGAHTIKVQLANAHIEVDDQLMQIVFMDDDTGRSCKSLLETSYQLGNLQNAVNQMMGKKMVIATKLTTKRFEDMNHYEKTKAIVEGTGVPVHHKS